VRQVGQMNQRTISNEPYLIYKTSLCRVPISVSRSYGTQANLSASVLMSAVPVISPTEMIALVEPAMIVPVAIGHAATIIEVISHDYAPADSYEVPISRHPVAAIIVSVHPRISRTRARRAVGRVSNTHCDSPLGCLSRVRAKHQSTGENCCSKYPFTYALHKYLRPSGL